MREFLFEYRKIAKVTHTDALEMDEFRLVGKIDQSPVFAFKDLISCSAIIFKCEKGYAGFHYPAQGLLPKYPDSPSADKYSHEMKQMISYIFTHLGEIYEVLCFTPDSLYGDCTVKDDLVAICEFFDNLSLQYGFEFNFASSLQEVTYEIEPPRRKTLV